MSNTKKYRYIAIGSTPPPTHVHFTRVIEGEIYVISKTENPNFVSITGKLFCKDGGFKQVYDKSLHIDMVKPFVQLQR
jgi:hypothetical protein